MKAKVSFFLAGLLIFAAPLQAKLMQPEGLVLKILGHYDALRQFQVSLKVRIFDPEALVSLDQPLPPQSPASEQVALGYTQQIVFVRDEVLFNQTNDLKGDILHLSIRSSGRQLEKNYNAMRAFSPQEVFFLPAVMVTKDPEVFKKRLGQLGINPSAVGTEPQGYKVLYRIGGPKENLLIDPKTYEVLGYNAQVSIEGRSYPLQVLFVGHYRKVPGLPAQILYYINGRLFKEATLTKVKTSRLSRKVRSLTKQYKPLLKQHESQLDDGLIFGP